jgi:Nif-specific regulatory protein
MDPKLVAIAGSLQGAIFTLTEGEASIGRDSSNLICINDRSVSRHHCLIRKEAGQFTVFDLNSRNGTWLGDVPVKEGFLEHGSRIRIGDAVFLLLLQEDEAAPTFNPVELHDGRLATLSTMDLRTDETFYLHPEKVFAALPAGARMAWDLNVLLKISRVIHATRGVQDLKRQLLELILQAIPAERGSILLVGKDLEEFASFWGWDKNSPGRPIQVSRTIVQRVLREGIALLGNNILENADFSPAESLVASRIHSLLATPLLVYEKPLGVIYLDTSDQQVCFDETHLQLLTAIAGIAAVALEKAQYLECVESENRRLQEEINIEHNMVGQSRPMREVYQFIGKVAPTGSTVLIRGESGTGKELVARAIHRNSPRAERPFVAINCATLTESLLESELFGHEKGAFTGAIAQKKGKLEMADGGTVFLDEVGELAPALQAKLLRVLQEQEFERVGGTRPIKVDIRLIAATNKNLEEAIKNQTFRQDLYYRLNVVSLTTPTLNERREDIPLLALNFAIKCSKKCKRQAMGLSPEARECLMNYHWPGNVRELENAIERAVVLSSSDLILPEDLPESVLEMEAANLPITKYHETIKETKKQLILRAVGQANGSYSEAAKLLGVNVKYLHRLIRIMDLRAALTKGGGALKTLGRKPDQAKCR